MKALLTICFIVISIGGTCQFQVSLNTGYGLYSLSDIKAFQKSQQSSFPVDAETTSSFPPYWIYGLSARAVTKNDLMIGFNGTLGSTGGRTYYEDYSGKIGSDQLLRFTSLSLSFGSCSDYGRRVYFYFDLYPGITFTSMKLRNFYSFAGNRTTEETAEFKSMNVTVQPTLGLIKRFGSVGINFFAGYHFTIVHGKLKLKENKDAYLVNFNNSDPVKADWSGLRVGVGVSLFLNSRPGSSAGSETDGH